jgi:hypothetical protein
MEAVGRTAFGWRLLAAAAIVCPGPSRADVAPPARHDFSAPNAWVIERTPDQIHELCDRNSPWEQGAGACALYLGKKKRCIILWPKGKQRSGLLWRHENAHCNGWPADHPN